MNGRCGKNLGAPQSGMHLFDAFRRSLFRAGQPKGVFQMQSFHDGESVPALGIAEKTAPGRQGTTEKFAFRLLQKQEIIRFTDSAFRFPAFHAGRFPDAALTEKKNAFSILRFRQSSMQQSGFPVAFQYPAEITNAEKHSDDGKFAASVPESLRSLDAEDAIQRTACVMDVRQTEPGDSFAVAVIAGINELQGVAGIFHLTRFGEGQRIGHFFQNGF